MKLFSDSIKNVLLIGYERHPWDQHYEVCRRDVLPGTRVVAFVRRSFTSGVPVISRESELKDALANPGNYDWIGQDKSEIGRVAILSLTFTSKPFKKDGHWFAKGKVEGSEEESEFSLYNLGIVPDYVERPERDGIYPAGWNPNSQTHFDRTPPKTG